MENNDRLNSGHRHQEEDQKSVYDAHCHPRLACPGHQASLQVETRESAKDGHDLHEDPVVEVNHSENGHHNCR